MKKLIVLLLIVLFPALVFAAGSSVTQTPLEISTHMRTLTFVCTGDDGTGAIANTDTNAANTAFIKGWYLIKVIADPGATAPDAADVLIKDSGGEDLLESDGTNLIHATNTQSIYPLSSADLHIRIPVFGALTLDVDNQATASATYTITLVFAR